jgi:hypothetical protein
MEIQIIELSNNKYEVHFIFKDKTISEIVYAPNEQAAINKAKQIANL